LFYEPLLSFKRKKIEKKNLFGICDHFIPKRRGKEGKRERQTWKEKEKRLIEIEQDGKEGF
jgi:hypothetical protein